mmetsp:Transcript_25633/g.50182  ORF Transcript_25633/g.50182 Transcript_25633/m.50182 type:complete len:267 (-) Transcript_25633:1106-1906(-)
MSTSISLSPHASLSRSDPDSAAVTRGTGRSCASPAATSRAATLPSKALRAEVRRIQTLKWASRGSTALFEPSRKSSTTLPDASGEVKLRSPHLSSSSSAAVGNRGGGFDPSSSPSFDASASTPPVGLFPSPPSSGLLPAASPSSSSAVSSLPVSPPPLFSLEALPLAPPSPFAEEGAVTFCNLFAIAARRKPQRVSTDWASKVVTVSPARVFQMALAKLTFMGCLVTVDAPRSCPNAKSISAAFCWSLRLLPSLPGPMPPSPLSPP